ncbi:Uncharacterised protein [Staphylococcus aureus]|nr:Uncharacterised protein [Staphylococcus aureus]
MRINVPLPSSPDNGWLPLTSLAGEQSTTNATSGSIISADAFAPRNPTSS